MDADAVNMHIDEGWLYSYYRPCYATLVPRLIIGHSRVYLYLTVKGKTKGWTINRSGNPRHKYGKGMITGIEFKIPMIIEVIIWISAIVRIVICIFPQNNWCTDEGNWIIYYQKCSLCNYWYRGDHLVFDFRKYLWISYDKDGCSYHYFFWLI